MEPLLSLLEKESIKIYQKYKQKLPKYKYLHQYVVSNFSGNLNYTEKGYTEKGYTEKEHCSRLFDELYIYVRELTKYYKALSDAAKSRDDHYKQYIKGIKEEDENHLFFREGLNSIVNKKHSRLLVQYLR